MTPSSGYRPPITCAHANTRHCSSCSVRITSGGFHRFVLLAVMRLVPDGRPLGVGDGGEGGVRHGACSVNNLSHVRNRRAETLPFVPCLDDTCECALGGFGTFNRLAELGRVVHTDVAGTIIGAAACVVSVLERSNLLAMCFTHLPRFDILPLQFFTPAFCGVETGCNGADSLSDCEPLLQQPATLDVVESLVAELACQSDGLLNPREKRVSFSG